VGIKLEGIKIDGIVHPFFAQFTSLEKRRIKPPDGLPHETADLGTNDRLVTREDLGSFDQIPNPEDPAVGYLFLTTSAKIM